ncbi:nicotinate-nucleotide adenylyltransferase [Thiocystis violascens]|uniref:Probable nicotinate-nucleotide adenylyltransferase n=1 Tax=Thiocystis violascens (strain ATCC 17096 / DSM 198 / 6111) TaxID=765911 RepID=I3Y7N0_THIV6|nr:nicotinate-nucleotide adenylyltransferase [Thiocystis violascens]AFL72998.1 nicotinate/nicotinamide nucleotide adenylyltransferase [Thiocystis violascens DSM 198]
MIGILGGTFDPIHFGHLRPALDCLQGLGLAEVRFIPLNVAVHRPQPQAAGALRLRMLEAAIAGQPGFVADARELERSGGSFSYDTLVSLRAELGPRVPLCLLVGADAFAGFQSWYRPLGILELAHLVVMRRPGHGSVADPFLRNLYLEHGGDDPASLAAEPGGRILYQDVTQVAISSTRIRQLVARGLSSRYLLPDGVLALIEREGLYRSVG